MGSWADLAVFERAHRANRLITRIYAAVPLSSWRRLADTVNARGFGDDWLRIGALKGFVDGSIGSHTAAMLQPFTDAPNGLRPPGEHAGTAVRVDVERRSCRPAGDRPRHRRSRHPHAARHLRARRARERRAGSPLPHRARAAHRAGRHGALREARRDRIDAAVPCDRRRALGRKGDRPGAREGNVRVSFAPRRRHDARLRLGLVRRAAHSAHRPLRRRDPAHARRAATGRLDAGAEDHVWTRRFAPTRPAERSRGTPRRTAARCGPECWPTSR